MPSPLRRVVVAALLLGALVSPACGSACAVAAPADAPAASRVAYAISDSRIDEASGIGVGVRSPGIDYVENDSGDVNRFFALNASTGDTAAVITVPDSTNVDWEDLAVAPAPDGTSSVWLADIGDNDGLRKEVDVYRVPEPRVGRHDHDRAITSRRPAVWRLRYPDGPMNAESLAVTPAGRAYIVTKSIFGDSGVYELPARPDRDHVRTLRSVGSIALNARKSSSPFGLLASLTATSAAISPDDAVLVVRTYTDAYLWRLDGGDVAAALRHRPTEIALPAQPQGEGITFDGRRLLVDSEGVRSRVLDVSLPPAMARVLATPASDPGSGPASGPGVRPGVRPAVRPGVRPDVSGHGPVVRGVVEAPFGGALRRQRCRGGARFRPQSRLAADPGRASGNVARPRPPRPRPSPHPMSKDGQMPLALQHPVAISVGIVAGLFVLAVLAAFVGRWLIRRGLQEPFIVRFINRLSDRLLDSVKRPITIAVLDEVADVLQTGNYTRNIASALQENREEIKQMVAEKIKDDPTAGAIHLLPFHDRIIEQASETTLRVILEVLADPRTDELVSDLLRDNITQIRQAVRDQQD